jgi:hypothetical protein
VVEVGLDDDKLLECCDVLHIEILEHLPEVPESVVILGVLVEEDELVAVFGTKLSNVVPGLEVFCHVYRDIGYHLFFD